MPDTIPRFGGDQFGTNYTPEDFQMSTESDDEVSTGDANECDEAEETAELEHGWEPPPIDLSSQNTNISDDHNSDNWESTDSTPTLPTYRLPVLSHRHIYTVKYSDRFPASQVDMPLMSLQALYAQNSRIYPFITQYLRNGTIIILTHSIIPRIFAV